MAFSAGRALPVLIGAFGIGYLESLTPLLRWHHRFELVGGISLVLIGVYLLNQYFLLL